MQSIMGPSLFGRPCSPPQRMPARTPSALRVVMIGLKYRSVLLHRLLNASDCLLLFCIFQVASPRLQAQKQSAAGVGYHPGIAQQQHYSDQRPAIRVATNSGKIDPPPPSLSIGRAAPRAESAWTRSAPSAPASRRDADSCAFGAHSNFQVEDERFFDSHQGRSSSNATTSAAPQSLRQAPNSARHDPVTGLSAGPVEEQRRYSFGNSPSAAPAVKYTSENIRIVYEQFRSMINPKGSKGTPRENGSSGPEVSGILAKKIIDRYDFL